MSQKDSAQEPANDFTKEIDDFHRMRQITVHAETAAPKKGTFEKIVASDVSRKLFKVLAGHSFPLLTSCKCAYNSYKKACLFYKNKTALRDGVVASLTPGALMASYATLKAQACRNAAFVEESRRRKDQIEAISGPIEFKMLVKHDGRGGCQRGRWLAEVTVTTSWTAQMLFDALMDHSDIRNHIMDIVPYCIVNLSQHARYLPLPAYLAAVWKDDGTAVDQFYFFPDCSRRYCPDVGAAKRSGHDLYSIFVYHCLFGKVRSIIEVFVVPTTLLSELKKLIELSLESLIETDQTLGIQNDSKHSFTFSNISVYDDATSTFGPNFIDLLDHSSYVNERFDAMASKTMQEANIKPKSFVLWISSRRK